MQELQVGKNESGQRLIRLLSRYLREAPDSFLYRMLRKKNIVLNERRATGKETLSEGDVIQIYMADATIAKFRGRNAGSEQSGITADQIRTFSARIVYEDDGLLIADKPAGMLSQRASSSDTALIDYAIAWLQDKGEVSAQSLETFKPGLVSRLDRNTSGLVIIGKSLAALQELNELVRDHRIGKYYTALAEGALTAPARLRGYWTKDESANLVRITQEPREGASQVVTQVWPEQLYQQGTQHYTLVRVALETGKGHQIRAHLASIGHPLAGDLKYGAKRFERELTGSSSEGYQRTGQLLHASELVFPGLQEQDSVLSKVSGKTFRAHLPEDFERVLHALEPCHGNNER